ncbi:hypothetical protein CONLIGDRAFT_453315 [Coniochaeta ligniaria NRRL 30616]|uniref:Uncharacterized protein n=1 Tax=Coniochaeta ligniaria NRRL 30616 TaxID=1408157 RepID=A0A1J7IKQ4_9PEZI|nr:hypothetical protein CONLIGDRAFT_453315 [Coniochaeta ligniaria NRRL 30616]
MPHPSHVDMSTTSLFRFDLSVTLPMARPAAFVQRQLTTEGLQRRGGLMECSIMLTASSECNGDDPGSGHLDSTCRLIDRNWKVTSFVRHLYDSPSDSHAHSLGEYPAASLVRFARSPGRRGVTKVGELSVQYKIRLSLILIGHLLCRRLFEHQYLVTSRVLLLSMLTRDYSEGELEKHASQANGSENRQHPLSLLFFSPSCENEGLTWWHLPLQIT